MSLLQQIQESVVEEGSDLGSILLKLRLLAARLGSDILEEWVKHESEGYPRDIRGMRKFLHTESSGSLIEERSLA